MDPKTTSSSALPSPAPLPSTDPPPFDVSSTEAVEAILCHRPEIMLSSQSLLHYKTALLCDSTTSRLECLNDAIESSRQALAVSPNSISFALFHAILLFQLARNDAGSYDAVVQECDHALLIENPTEPGYEVPVQASRLKKIREVIGELIEKSKWQIIVFGGENRRGNWKRLVEDNSLAKVKAEFEGALLKNSGTPGWRAPRDFERLPKKKKIKKHKEVESNDQSSQGVLERQDECEKKRKLLRIGIEDLKVYLNKNKFRTAKNVLTEAIDYAKAENIWRFWACSYCGDRVSDPNKHLTDHIHFTESYQSLWLDEAPKWAIDMVETAFGSPWNRFPLPPPSLLQIGLMLKTVSGQKS